MTPSGEPNSGDESFLLLLRLGRSILPLSAAERLPWVSRETLCPMVDGWMVEERFDGWALFSTSSVGSKHDESHGDYPPRPS